MIGVAIKRQIDLPARLSACESRCHCTPASSSSSSALLIKSKRSFIRCKIAGHKKTPGSCRRQDGHGTSTVTTTLLVWQWQIGPGWHAAQAGRQEGQQMPARTTDPHPHPHPLDLHLHGTVVPTMPSLPQRIPRPGESPSWWGKGEAGTSRGTVP
jgi:hypothetical protein